MSIVVATLADNTKVVYSSEVIHIPSCEDVENYINYRWKDYGEKLHDKVVGVSLLPSDSYPYYT